MFDARSRSALFTKELIRHEQQLLLMGGGYTFGLEIQFQRTARGQPALDLAG
jgi:hypothetical protein